MRSNARVRLATLCLAALASCRETPAPKPPPAAPSQAAVRAWVILGEDGVRVVRALAEGGKCPTIDAGGLALATTARAPSDEAFPTIVCEVVLPEKASSASIGGRALPLPKARVDRIVVFGDTGCRMKEGAFQACNDEAAWPFAKIAKAAAAWKPDLVVHVGDYLYRKTPCPPDRKECAGSPTGDRFATWDADFLAPARALLDAAPWIVVRGNHEGCSSGGQGFFRLLDPRPLSPSCIDMTPPYVARAGDLRFWVVDSVTADDAAPKPEKVEAFRAQLASLEAASQGARAWLVTHRPLWAVFGAPRAGAKEAQSGLVPLNATLQAAFDAASPSSVDLVLSGHVHLFESVSFDGKRPPQLVVGTGGTMLDVPVANVLDGVVEAGAKVEKGTARGQFGFLALERGGAGWSATLRDPDGAVLTTCTIAGRTIACAP
jgi:hypothetical protein